MRRDGVIEYKVNGGKVTSDMGHCTRGLEIMRCEKNARKICQVKYCRIFLLFLNSELCPGITPCPKLPPFTLHQL